MTAVLWTLSVVFNMNMLCNKVDPSKVDFNSGDFLLLFSVVESRDKDKIAIEVKSSVVAQRYRKMHAFLGRVMIVLNGLYD